MSAFYTFLSSLYNCLLKNLVNDIRCKVLRGGAENFRRGAKSSQGKCAPPPKIRPLLLPSRKKQCERILISA